ncbi:MAG: hypothetical protein ACHQIG_03730 [Acidimicrobiia bacterium]
MNDSWDDQSDRTAGFEGRMRSMRRWRLAISVGSLVLGLVLVTTGNVLIGAIIGTLAVARLVMFSRFPVPVRGARRRTDLDASDRQWLRAQARDEFLVASRVIGCPISDLRDQLQQGRSLADVASARSVDVERLTEAITADIATKAVDAEHTGALSHAAAQRVQSLAPRFAGRLVHDTRGGIDRV